MGFDVSNQEQVIKFDACQGGKYWPVEHVFGEVGEKDILAFRRDSMDFVQRKGGFRNKGNGDLAAKKLWNKCVKSVSGYSAGDKNLMDLPNWRDLVPLPHKIQAVNSLFKTEEAEAEEPGAESPLAE